MIVLTPAKLNLMLHITGRRADGYHRLQTVFQFIDLFDEIELVANFSGQINCRNNHLDLEPDKDLVFRAATLLKSYGQVDNGVDISVKKSIPIGGGLGGGSSDAAACLLALNYLWELALDIEQLAVIGLQLGADVPVFIKGQACWAEGVGERIEPVILDESVYFVLNPRINVSTVEIFNAKELTRNCDPITIRAFLGGLGQNVFEPVVFARYPEIKAARDWLAQYADVRLTGTGGCLFARFDSKAEAESIKNRIPDQWQAFIVLAMNSNPVHQQIGSKGEQN
ncbi:MAG: 4-diphosphocytidyl-2-C-methyl-D-erythritol kinase [Gammaproteobacteria bacterium]|jgi:4-diphosphocytidyl-2-C-methyl-D-erythritol kinase